MSSQIFIAINPNYLYSSHAYILIIIGCSLMCIFWNISSEIIIGILLFIKHCYLYFVIFLKYHVYLSCTIETPVSVKCYNLWHETVFQY